MNLNPQPAILTRHKNGGQAAGKLAPRNSNFLLAIYYQLSLPRLPREIFTPLNDSVFIFNWGTTVTAQRISLEPALLNRVHPVKFTSVTAKCISLGYPPGVQLGLNPQRQFNWGAPLFPPLFL